MGQECVDAGHDRRGQRRQDQKAADSAEPADEGGQAVLGPAHAHDLQVAAAEVAQRVRGPQQQPVGGPALGPGAAGGQVTKRVRKRKNKISTIAGLRELARKKGFGRAPV